MTTVTNTIARLAGNAIATRLAGVTHATGYYGQIGRPLPGLDASTPADPPAKAGQDPRVAPYFVLYPDPGVRDDTQVSLSDSHHDSVQTHQVTAVAGDIEDLLALVDRINTRLLGWTPTVPGARCSQLQPPPGYRPGHTLHDQNVTPHRLYLPLQYRLVLSTSPNP